MALESKRSVFLSASLSQSRDRSVLQRFGATERPTAICKLAPSSVVSRRATRTAKVGAGNASSHFERDEANKTNCFNRRHGRATTPPLSSSDRDGGSTPRAKWKTTPESGCRMRHLPFRSKSLALVCQQRQRGRVRIYCETPRFVHGTQLRGKFTLAPVPRGRTGIGHRQSSSCKKARSAKAIYQTTYPLARWLLGLPETRTNALDIEERERGRNREKEKEE